MSNFIGISPAPKAARKYFYKLTRNNNSELIFTRIDLEEDFNVEEVIVDPELRTTESQHEFEGFDTDYVVVNIDADHMIIDESLGRAQYKVRTDDLYYFVNEQGQLIVRVNQAYSY